MDTWTVIKSSTFSLLHMTFFFFKIIEVLKNFSITAVSLSTILQRNLSPSHGMLRALC